MEEKDKWINNLRHRMEDYSEPAPADLWGQLEKELKNTPKVIPMWRRWQAVAAIAMLVVVSSVTVWFWHSSSADYIGRKSVEIASVSKLTEMEELAPLQPSLAETTPEAVLPSVKEKGKINKYVTQKKEIAVYEAVPAVANEIVEEKQSITEKVIEEKEPDKQVQKGKSKQGGAVKTTKRKNYYAYVAPRQKRETKWSVGLSAGNVPYSSNTGYSGYKNLPGVTTRNVSVTTFPFETVAPHSDTFEKMLFNNIDKQTETKIEHRMPITFGASLRFELDNKWGIETGVTYTMLATDLQAGTKESYFKDEQRLHYVGIPLKVNRRLWNNKRLEIYASAGGAVEKCVSGTLHRVDVADESDQKKRNTKLTVKPLQWSLSATAGAQFKLTEQFGIYAEPGVAYYFDDGSDIATIRKEHPFNFNLQVGLRFSLPK